ncbi:MAG: DUF2332 domain-containing protein, partial [Actinomycetota bacterium]
MTSRARRAVAELFREQAGWCGRLGSPLYATLLKYVAENLEAGAAASRVLAGHERDPPRPALPLRLMGAVHRMVLEGRAGDLAHHFPSVGGKEPVEAALSPFARLLGERTEEVRELLGRPVQTNEVGRAAALIGGFLLTASETGLPLRLLEIGASAGLNLRWDCYRYEAGNGAWGDPNSPVRLVDAFESGGLPFGIQATVEERSGCDLAPIDPTQEEGRLTLTSYVWADQVDRLGLLRAALDVAQRVPATVDQADACDWLESKLLEQAPGLATVVFHSMVLEYLNDAGRRRLRRLLVTAGSLATDRTPLS